METAGQFASIAGVAIQAVQVFQGFEQLALQREQLKIQVYTLFTIS